VLISETRSGEAPQAMLALLAVALLTAWPGPARSEDGSSPQVEWIGAAGEPIPGDPGTIGVFQPDPDCPLPSCASQRFKVVVRADHRRPKIRLALVSTVSESGRRRDRLADVELFRRGDGALESPWLVLVASEKDHRAPGLNGLALRAGLGDRIEARVRRGGGRATIDSVRAGWVDDAGRPGEVLRVRLRTTVLRIEPGGPPIVGGDRSGARALVEHQLAVLNEVLAQCGIWAGAPRDADWRIVDPPAPSLIAVGGRLGYYSAGGEVRLQLDGVRHGPWRLGSGYTPVETARALGRRLVEAGYRVAVTENPRNRSAAHPTADLSVHRADGAPAEISTWPDQPLSTDPQQPLEIGVVSLDDGLDPYGPNQLLAGTLEERALIKGLADPERKVIELFLINRFSGLAKQGESFVRAAGQALGDVVVLDWRALGRARQAFTLPHEIGHVLLGDLGHPDGRGDARPWLLMNSRASSAVGGPRSLTGGECRAMRGYLEGEGE